MKKSTIFVCQFTLVLFLAGMSFALAPTPATSTQKAAKRKAPKSDADIQTCITERIAAAPNLQGESITVIVADRTVTLNGTATTIKNRNAAASLARKCNVSRVTNNLEVRAAATKPSPQQ